MSSAAIAAQTPSPQQAAIYDWVQRGKGSAVVVAVAGAGKSTTAANAIQYMTGTVSTVMYGKKAATEFQTKLDSRGLNKRAKNGTAHSFGCGAWLYANRNRKIVIDEKKKWERVVNECAIPEEFQSFVKSAVSLAKQRAIGFLTKMDDWDAWTDMVNHFNLEMELSDEGDVDEDTLSQAIDCAIDTLKFSNSIAREIIDFDDMPYLPLIFNVRMFQVDWLIVDEAQDTNPARRALYRKMLKPGGRAMFIGDPKQAIFGFTGADNDSMEIIKKEFNCQTLELTNSFRCPKAVVAHAQTWVNHIQAASDREGSVEYVELKDFVKQFAQLQPTDAILCRNTKPLVELAFRLIRNGIGCHVEGREIGQGLIALCRKWKVQSLDKLKDKLEIFLENEVEKLMAKGKETAAESLADRVGTVFVLMEGMPAGSTVNDLVKKIDSMFKNSEDEERKTLTLCTVHRSKGLEWPTVYLLGRNKFMPSKFARQDWQMDQEDNLCYVAVTRSMDRLVEVGL